MRQRTQTLFFARARRFDVVHELLGRHVGVIEHTLAESRPRLHDPQSARHQLGHRQRELENEIVQRLFGLVAGGPACQTGQGH